MTIDVFSVIGLTMVMLVVLSLLVLIGLFLLDTLCSLTGCFNFVKLFRNRNNKSKQAGHGCIVRINGSFHIMEWLPIEQAPKPSGRLLLSAGGQTCYGHYYATEGEWVYDGYDWGNPKCQPTHFMRLPEAVPVK